MLLSHHRRRTPLILSTLITFVGSWWSPGRAQEARVSNNTATAVGVVYHDMNGNGQHEANEPGLPGVKVSNGSEIVPTDAQGQYSLPISDDTILFVIKPRNWRTPINEQNLPQFYYIHKPNGSPRTRFPGVAPTGPLPASVDFPLMPQVEPDQFKAIMFGDPQPRDQDEVDYIAHDVVESLIGTDAAFGVTLGDIVFDNLALFESQARAIALIGIPWYNVIGNHDINYDAPNDQLSDESFERVFGPAYYSFDYGPVHFLVLDDVRWLVDDGQEEGRYEGGLGTRQMEFIERDLARIPQDQLVVLMMHIPLIDVQDRHQLYRLIEQRPFCMSISAHRHIHQHVFIDQADGWKGPEPHHHVINITVCGSWWSGQKDERGIPHALMADGAPNGHSIIHFDGHQYALDVIPAGRPADYQMNVYVPESIPSSQLAETEILVNVFNGSPRSTVDYRLIGTDDTWHQLTFAPQLDPNFIAVAQREQTLREATADTPAEAALGIQLPKVGTSQHIWAGKLNGNLTPGTYLLEARTIDMHGRTYLGRRSFRVKK